MTRIERRHQPVPLYSGSYHSRLAAIMEEAMAAERKERAGATQRFGTKSVANAKAIEYDELAAEADQSATIVNVWALRYDHMTDLQDEHPPREDEPRDATYSVNMKTFPRALAEASLVDPELDDGIHYPDSLEDLKAQGHAAMLELGPSKAQYLKLETAAWNVNVLGDEIPKESLASLLMEARKAESAQQPDSESAPKSSTASSRKRRMSTTTPKASTPDEPSSPATPGGTTAP